jgi:opacity protein-like surface antigen
LSFFRKITGKRCYYYGIGGLLFMITIIPIASFAGQVVFVPGLRVATQYDDNLDFSSENEEDDFSASIKPGFTLDYSTELLKLNGSANVDYQKYYDESDYDRTNQFYKAGTEYRAHPRWTLTGSYFFRRDETTDSQFEETGRSFERERKQTHNASAGVRYTMTQLSDIGPVVTYRKVDYSGPDDDDYNLYFIELPYRKRFQNQLDTITLTPRYAYLDSDTEEANGYRLTLGWEHLLSETLTSDIMIGGRYTDIEDKDTDDNNSNWGGLGSIALRKAGETFSGRMGYSRDIGITRDGELIEIDRIFVSGDKRITERFGLQFKGNAYHSTTENKDTPDDTVISFELGPAAYYMLTQNHSVRLSYDYRYEKELDEPGDPTTDRNLVILSFNFLFPKRWD